MMDVRTQGQPQDQASDRLMREDEVADLLGMSIFTLQTWRRPGMSRGPRWVNVGTDRRSIIRYRESDIQAWIADLPSGRTEVDACLDAHLEATGDVQG